MGSCSSSWPTHVKNPAHPAVCAAVAELAEQCYEAARGAEPTLVSVWEAMAATAAARGSSSAGTAAAAAAAEHAVGLGGGPESWLEYATGAFTTRLGL
jgi:hypothetical protein